MQDEFIAAMHKHLPPSAATLRLLDVDGAVGVQFLQQRGDLDITAITGAAAEWRLAPDSFDAVVALDRELDADFLAASLHALRPGGRLIVVQSAAQVSEDWVALLEGAGYTRLLVEPALDDGRGLLLRGEKPHTRQRTTDRIQQVAGRDAETSLEDARSRYVYLLIRQVPNKPVWALQPGDKVEWFAAVAASDDGPALLAFSSLPRAVAFMQPAVMQGLVQDINKVGKFSRETASTWTLPVIFNPTVEALAGHEILFSPVDPATAEAPDE